MLVSKLTRDNVGHSRMCRQERRQSQAKRSTSFRDQRQGVGWSETGDARAAMQPMQDEQSSRCYARTCARDAAKCRSPKSENGKSSQDNKVRKGRRNARQLGRRGEDKEREECRVHTWEAEGERIDKAVLRC
jgi:hypothetical protein